MNGQHMLIYTTEDGGHFRALTRNGEVYKTTREEYDRIVATGEIDVTSPWEHTGSRTVVKPALVMLARVEAHHDFVLGGERTKLAVA